MFFELINESWFNFGCSQNAFDWSLGRERERERERWDFKRFSRLKEQKKINLGEDENGKLRDNKMTNPTNEIFLSKSQQEKKSNLTRWSFSR